MIFACDVETFLSPLRRRSCPSERPMVCTPSGLMASETPRSFPLTTTSSAVMADTLLPEDEERDPVPHLGALVEPERPLEAVDLGRDAELAELLAAGERAHDLGAGPPRVPAEPLLDGRRARRPVEGRGDERGAARPQSVAQGAEMLERARDAVEEVDARREPERARAEREGERVGAPEVGVRGVRGVDGDGPLLVDEAAHAARVGDGASPREAPRGAEHAEAEVDSEHEAARGERERRPAHGAAHVEDRLRDGARALEAGLEDPYDALLLVVAVGVARDVLPRRVER